MSQRVAVVTGSTRPGRITPVIAAWILSTLPRATAISYEALDLAAVGLPFLDEARKPAAGDYAHPHTRAWSKTVSGFDGFVFVFPQYNWGYPAPLKNALDFLYVEWSGKPAALVSHGTRGGGRAAAQLREVLLGLHMRPLEAPVLLSIAADAVDDDEQLLDPAATLAPFATDVQNMHQGLLGAFGARP
jgi:NAD(P)H-dependent FMN reductase